MLASLALISLLQAPSIGAGDLSLTNVRFTFGVLGPTRAEAKVRPGDNLFLSFDIQGISTDDSGKASYSTSVEVSDSTGKVAFSQPARKLQEHLPLGGDVLPAFAQIDLGLDSPKGEYTMKVSITDTSSGKSASVSMKFEVLPKGFDLTRFSFTGDSDGVVPIAAYGVGQPFWFHGSVVGFTRSPQTKQPNVVLRLRVVDESGKFVKPFTGTVDKDVEASATSLPVRFFVPLNKAGKYTIEVLATDDVKGTTVTKKFPITVFPAK